MPHAFATRWQRHILWILYRAMGRKSRKRPPRPVLKCRALGAIINQKAWDLAEEPAMQVNECQEPAMTALERYFPGKHRETEETVSGSAAPDAADRLSEAFVSQNKDFSHSGQVVSSLPAGQRSSPKLGKGAAGVLYGTFLHLHAPDSQGFGRKLRR